MHKNIIQNLFIKILFAVGSIFTWGRYFSNNAKNQTMQNTVLFITYVQKYYLAMLWDTNNEWVEWQDEMQNNDEDKI